MSLIVCGVVSLSVILLISLPRGCSGLFPLYHNSGPSGSPLYASTLFGPPNREPSSTQLPQTLFASKNNTELRAQVGSTIALHCPVVHVGENTVTWIRRHDYHLLTVGTTLYSSDQRYQIRHFKNDQNLTQDWQLHIRYVQKHDEGEYECQVSSHPPISLMTMLHVVEATSEILGGPEKFLRIGSSLRLVCVLKKTTQPPSYVFWYLNQKMINYDEKVKVETSGDVSVLFLNDLGPESSGNYSCVPSNAKESTIHIQILRGGEIPAAIQSGIKHVNPSAQNVALAFISLLLISRNFFSDFSNLFHFTFIYPSMILARSYFKNKKFLSQAQFKILNILDSLPYQIIRH